MPRIDFTLIDRTNPDDATAALNDVVESGGTLWPFDQIPFGVVTEKMKEQGDVAQ